jgi:phosphate transport system substrate-binding protein
MNNLMTSGPRASEAVPERPIEIEGKGSSTAPPALIAGTAQLRADEPPDEGEGDRRVREEVRLQAVRLPIAIDMLAVYVHKDNPIESLTLQQVDAIFSKTRKGGGEGSSRPGATSA